MCEDPEAGMSLVCSLESPGAAWGMEGGDVRSLSRQLLVMWSLFLQPRLGFCSK